MAGESALDRYAEARRRLDHAAEILIRKADWMDEMSRRIRSGNLDFPIEGIGEWTAIRKHPDLFKREDWPDFDQLKDLITHCRQAQQAERTAWGNLRPEEQG